MAENTKDKVIQYLYKFGLRADGYVLKNEKQVTVTIRMPERLAKAYAVRAKKSRRSRETQIRLLIVLDLLFDFFQDF